MSLRSWWQNRGKPKAAALAPEAQVMEPVKMGRPEWIPGPRDLARVEAAAARGLNKDQIALSIGVGYSTMAAKYKQFPEIQEAIKRGQDNAIIKIQSELFETAIGKRGRTGKMTAMIFWLKNKGGWSDRQTMQGNPGKPLWIGAVHAPPTLEQGGERLSILDEAREDGIDPPELSQPETH